MTYDKVKIDFLMTMFTISLVSVAFTQSFAEENISQEQERQNAIEQQTNLFSSNPIFEEKISIEGYDRLVSKVDPGIGHENQG